MIVVDTQHFVQGSAPEITRINVQDEINLIKVNMFPEQEFGYFFIGTLDRDLYIIYEDTTQPDPDRIYKFYVLEDGTYEYVDITPEPDPEP
jgi:hypothetical protein